MASSACRSQGCIQGTVFTVPSLGFAGFSATLLPGPTSALISTTKKVSQHPATHAYTHSHTSQTACTNTISHTSKLHMHVHITSPTHTSAQGLSSMGLNSWIVHCVHFSLTLLSFFFFPPILSYQLMSFDWEADVRA
jgi:hypothetical protein